MVMLDINSVFKSIRYQFWYRYNETNNGFINIDNDFVIERNICYLNNCFVQFEIISRHDVMKLNLVSLNT